MSVSTTYPVLKSLLLRVKVQVSVCLLFIQCITVYFYNEMVERENLREGGQMLSPMSVTLNS